MDHTFNAFENVVTVDALIAATAAFMEKYEKYSAAKVFDECSKPPHFAFITGVLSCCGEPRGSRLRRIAGRGTSRRVALYTVPAPIPTNPRRSVEILSARRSDD